MPGYEKRKYTLKKEWLAKRGYTVLTVLSKEEKRELEAFLQDARKNGLL